MFGIPSRNAIVSYTIKHDEEILLETQTVNASGCALLEGIVLMKMGLIGERNQGSQLGGKVLPNMCNVSLMLMGFLDLLKGVGSWISWALLRDVN